MKPAFIPSHTHSRVLPHTHSHKLYWNDSAAKITQTKWSSDTLWITFSGVLLSRWRTGSKSQAVCLNKIRAKSSSVMVGLPPECLLKWEMESRTDSEKPNYIVSFVCMVCMVCVEHMVWMRHCAKRQKKISLFLGFLFADLLWTCNTSKKPT